VISWGVVLLLIVPLFLYVQSIECIKDKIELIKALATWAQVIVAGIAAYIAYKNFALPFIQNGRIKSIEILMALEKDYRPHFPFLLEIEIESTYKKIESVLEREELQRKPAVELSAKQKIDIAYNAQYDMEVLQKLDGLLRHFYVCLKAKKKSVIDDETIDSSYKYYLMMLTAKTWIDEVDGVNVTKPDEKPRLLLGKYVKLYWPSIDKWSFEFKGVTPHVQESRRP
jgi:hypothetical protein